MDAQIKEYIDNLASRDDKIRMKALETVLALTDKRVDWVYDVWDKMFEMLNHSNSFLRTIGIEVLCNLAKSDYEDRLNDSLDRLLSHTKDEKFVTSRKCLLAIWKVAVAKEQHLAPVLDHLEKRYIECVEEKHPNLLRLDIIKSMRHVYDETNDDSILTRAKNLVSKESEEKHRKKYEKILRT